MSLRIIVFSHCVFEPWAAQHYHGHSWLILLLQESFSNSSHLIELTMPPLCSSSCLTVLKSVSPTGLKFLEGRCQVLTLYVWPQSWRSKHNSLLILFFLWKETIEWMDIRNMLFQVCDLEVGTVRGGGNHRFLGCCKLHPIHQGPSFVGRPKKSYFTMKFSNSINAIVIHEANKFISKSQQRCNY